MKALSIFFFSFLLLLVVPMISSQSEVTFQFNTEYDFKRTCFNNGTFCSPASFCNVTIVRPDTSVLVNNQRMTNQISFHNITIQQVDNNVLGTFPFILSCTDGSNSGGETGNIIITADGNAIQIFPTQFFIVIIAFFFISLGMFQERSRLFKHVGSITLMIFGVITLFPGYSLINWTTLAGKAIGFGAIGLGFYFLIEDSFSRDVQEEGGLSASPRQFFRGDKNDGRHHQ